MCVFCKIIAGEIPAQKVYEDERVLAFHDIEPHAPVHVVIIPKKHVPNCMALQEGDLAGILDAVQEVARRMNVTDSGFRLVMNCGKDAGQTVEHVHIHLLGGKQLSLNLA